MLLRKEVDPRRYLMFSLFVYLTLSQFSRAASVLPALEKTLVKDANDAEYKSKSTTFNPKAGKSDADKTSEDGKSDADKTSEDGKSDADKSAQKGKSDADK